jgi:adenosylhomocysteinase
MGIDDEFGPGVDSERVLGGKSPIDFSLSEPTLMRYMDPVFAVSNEALVQLRQGSVDNGIHPPDNNSEALVAAAMRAVGANRSELDMIVEITGRTDLL